MAHIVETFPHVDADIVLDSDGDIRPKEDYLDIDGNPIDDPEEVAASQAPELSAEKTAQHSAAYDAVVATIEAGIAKSKAHGYRDLKVELIVEDKTMPKGTRIVTKPLALYLANDAYVAVGSEEWKLIEAAYRDVPVEYRSAQYKGRVVAKVAYKSAGHVYRDVKSAIAGDDTLE